MKKHLPVIILFVISILSIFFFRVSKIECEIESKPCPSDIATKLDLYKGRSLFFTNYEEIFTKETTDHPIYQIENIQKKLPGKLFVSLKREPVLYKIILFNDQQEKSEFSFGNSAVEIPNSSNQEKLAVEWKENYSPITNNLVEPNIHVGLVSLSNELQNMQIDQALLIWNTDSEIRLLIPDKPDFIFDIETLQTQSKKIDTILSSRELDEFKDSAQEIDMRFDLPVLRTDG